MNSLGNELKEQAGTLNCMDDHEKTVGTDGVDYVVRKLTPTECARLQGFPDWWGKLDGNSNPTEEEIDWAVEVLETHRKAMGISDKPTTRNKAKAWLAKPYSESAEYKLWGNGIALPNAIYCLEGVADELRKSHSAWLDSLLEDT